MKYLLISYDRHDYKEVSESFVRYHYLMNEFYENFRTKREMQERIQELEKLGFTKQIY